MSPERRGDGGIPHTRGVVSAPLGGGSREERWPGANEEKAEKLRVRSLKRQAGVQGFELRHSAYGYSLIDPARKPVDDRNDMSLDQVELWLDRALKR